MATESDLRDLLHDPSAGGSGGIDVGAVLRGARRRRRPRVLLAAAGGALAVSAVLTPAVALTLPSQEASLLATQESAGGEAADSAVPAAPADATLRAACGAPAPDLVTTDAGLEVELDAASWRAGTDAVSIPVVLGNVGADHVTGEVSAVRLLVVGEDGIVADGTPAAVGAIDLDPGEEVAFRTEFAPVDCRTGAPLTPGDYRMYAEAEVSVHGAAGGITTLAGPSGGVPFVVR